MELRALKDGIGSNEDMITHLCASADMHAILENSVVANADGGSAEDGGTVPN